MVIFEDKGGVRPLKESARGLATAAIWQLHMQVVRQAEFTRKRE